MRHSLAALLLAGFTLGPSVATAVRHGDLLITDFANNRVLEVDPSTGVVTTFSPVGVEANLLTLPLGIAADPDGGVYVSIEADPDAPNLVAIDARGNQSFVGGGTVSNPWVSIEGAFGLAMSPVAASAGARRDLFVAGKGALWSVQQTTEAHSTPLSPYGAPHQDASGQYVSVRDPGSGSPDAQVGFTDAILPYDGDLFAFGAPWIPASGSYINSFAYSQEAGLFVLSLFSDSSGIYSLGDLNPATAVLPVAVGGDVGAPSTLTVALPGEGDPAPYPVFVVDSSATVNVVRVDSDGSTTPVATLQGNTDCYCGMTLYAPEPASALLAATALAALVWVRASRI